jgi:hypothetical protein
MKRTQKIAEEYLLISYICHIAAAALQTSDHEDPWRLPDNPQRSYQFRSQDFRLEEVNSVFLFLPVHLTATFFRRRKVSKQNKRFSA